MANRGLGTLTLSLVTKIAGFTGPLDQAGRKLSDLEKRAYAVGKGIGTALRTIAGVAAGAAVSAVTALTAVTVAAINQADAMRDLSIRTGVSTEILSAYGYAAKQTGTDIDELGKGLILLSKNATAALDPKSRQAGLFKALLGDDYKKDLGDLETLVPKIATAFAGLEDGPTKAALALQLFGRSGANMIEFLNSGGEGLDEFAQKAADLGVIISQDTADSADNLNDTLADLKTLTGGLGLQIAEALLPSLVEAAEDFRDLVKEGDFASNMVEVLSGILSAGVGVINGYNYAVSALSIKFEELAKSAQGFKEVQANIGIGGLFDEGSIVGGFEKVELARKEAEKALIDLRAEGEKTKSVIETTLPSITVRGSAADIAKAEADAKSLARFLANPSGRTGSKKTGKSDAEKEAESLQKAYESMNERLKEQVALFGTTGEAAKLRYELEFGELSKLTQVQKDQLLVQAESYDQMVLIDELQKAANETVKKETEAYEDRRESNAELISNMEFELELLGMTNKERERAIALSYLSADATDEEKQAVIDLSGALIEANKAAEFWDDFQGSMANSLYDVATRAKTAEEAIGDFIDSIFKSSIRAASDYFSEALTNMFKSFGGSGSSGSSGGTGGWAELFGALFGGGRAVGGPVSAGRFYEVGEQDRPELLMAGGKQFLIPGNNGNVVPMGPRGGRIEQKFYTLGLETRRTSERKAQLAGREAQRALARTGR